MIQKKYLYLSGFLIFLLVIAVILFPKQDESLSTSKLTAKVLTVGENQITVQDEKNIIYTFHAQDVNIAAGEVIVMEYTGLLDKTNEVQKGSLVNILPVSSDEENRARSRSTPGIFSQFQELANNRLKTMTLDEKIGQILLVRYPDSGAKEALEKYHFGGFVFFEKDFRDKTEKEVQDMMRDLQDVSKIPLLTAVDEEGGSVVRVSSNPKLAASPFSSSQELYQNGGFDLIREDTVAKSKLLENLGINVNLAPVVDVSLDPNDYMYNRSLGESTALTSTYAETVIRASKNDKVSYVMKHFPGYGNNGDTHQGVVLDNRTFSTIETNDLPPFEAGIEAGAEAILVSHNTVVNIDNNNPASLSPSIHNLLRNNLNFTGIIMTDDLSMGATSFIDHAVVKALLAGNDIVMVTDYEKSVKEIKDALQDGTISEDLLDDINHRILSWKYYKGLMFLAQK